MSSHLYPIRLMCKVLDVSASGYYAWCNHKPSRWELAKRDLLVKIKEVFTASRQTYGSPRIHAELVANGVACSPNHIARLMRESGLRAVTRRRNRVRNDRSQNWKQAPNLLKRRFQAGGLPAWVADLTQLQTRDGVLHLAVVMNMYSRRIIGWSMDRKATGELTLNALKMAIDQVDPVPGQLHHTDRGGQYVSREYQSQVRKSGMVISMSRGGNCYDNAVMESMFASLKCEMAYRMQPKTYLEARGLVFDYIEVFYNRQRRHSALGYVSPVEYERLNGVP